MKNPGEEILKSYNVPVTKAEEIDLPVECVGVITHFLHQDSKIVSGGVFGSRADENMKVTDSSDIDLGIVLKEYNEDKIARIDFKINKRYRSITGDKTEIHTCCLNDSVEHLSEYNETTDQFRKTLKDQIVMLKGSIEDFD